LFSVSRGKFLASFSATSGISHLLMVAVPLGDDDHHLQAYAKLMQLSPAGQQAT
jgi:hypothetical protein